MNVNIDICHQSDGSLIAPAITRLFQRTAVLQQGPCLHFAYSREIKLHTLYYREDNFDVNTNARYCGGGGGGM